ncbi:hypothetical protein FQA47_008885 [Oryzias melastigma]|uniref:Uncharacterized protein n=1 Tax=Oryzias melastigma TaxID=30732 RepID=A0A834BLF7_ORYME|nr:hypothetical protein FQA47_008885 [Oryzias melastigma]
METLKWIKETLKPRSLGFSSSDERWTPLSGLRKWNGSPALSEELLLSQLCEALPTRPAVKQMQRPGGLRLKRFRSSQTVEPQKVTVALDHNTSHGSPSWWCTI